MLLDSLPSVSDSLARLTKAHQVVDAANAVGPSTGSLEDQLIAVAIVLFILSQVTERLANLVKLTLPQPSEDDKPGDFRWFGNLKVREDDHEKEKQRERGVLILNILCGIAVAVITLVPYNCGALATPPSLQWLKSEWWFLLAVIGGMFISFGSKFWHDALDLLYAYKLARQKIADPTPYQQESVEELTAHLSILSREIARQAKKDNHEVFENAPGVTSYDVTTMRFGSEKRSVIEVHVEEPEQVMGLPKEVETRMYGKHRKVQVVTIAAGAVSISSGGPVGEAIHNASKPSNAGTFGCVVKDRVGTTRYLLSCYHVLRADQPWARFTGAGDRSIKDEAGAVVAQLHDGCRTTETDSAIARLANPTHYDNSLPDGKRIAGRRDLKQSDEDFQTPVRFSGKMTIAARGIIYARSRRVKITYPDGPLWMDNMILITDDRSGVDHAVGVHGDSGAVVVDEDGKALGMVVATGKNYTYLTPIASALGPFDVEIV